MKCIEKQAVINQNIQNVFDMIFNNNEDSLPSSYQMVNKTNGDWIVKRNIKQKLDEYSLYIETLPDECAKYTIEGDKYVRFSVRHKMKKDLKRVKIIKTRYRILNVNPILRTIINGLELLKVKMVTELRKYDENVTYVNIKIFVNTYLPKSQILEPFLLEMCNNILGNLIDSLHKNI